jgi:hypothetical protein
MLFIDRMDCGKWNENLNEQFNSIKLHVSFFVSLIEASSQCIKSSIYPSTDVQRRTNIGTFAYERSFIDSNLSRGMLRHWLLATPTADIQNTVLLDLWQLGGAQIGRYVGEVNNSLFGYSLSKINQLIAQILSLSLSRLPARVKCPSIRDTICQLRDQEICYATRCVSSPLGGRVFYGIQTDKTNNILISHANCAALRSLCCLLVQ